MDVAASVSRELRACVAVAAAVAVASVAAGGVTAPGRGTAAEGNSAQGPATAQVTGSAVKRPLQRTVLRLQKSRRLASRPRVLQVKAPAKPRPAVRRQVVPNDPYWSASWSLAKVHAEDAWSVTTGAAETVVAVLDTGVDFGHPDLQGAFVPGYDVVNHDADAVDDHGHGTMVAGVIAARGNNEIGVTGACWRCSVMPVKVIGADGSGTAGDVAEGIRWATDHGASVINMSFAMTGPDPAVEAAVGYASGRGVLLVAAAGNAGTTDPGYPAAYPGVLSVGATDPSDARYPWSSYGSWVRVAAPGCSMTTGGGATYADFCGTSSAAAFASGLAGLGRSYGQRPAGTVVEALASSSQPVGEVVAAGRVDADALLKALGAGQQTLREIPQPPQASTAATASATAD